MCTSTDSGVASLPAVMRCTVKTVRERAADLCPEALTRMRTARETEQRFRTGRRLPGHVARARLATRAGVMLPRHLAG
ncbi:hypothetical protein GCM10010145_47070 [Streptomyces ruber]|uniref:Uncharacterized protein n=2 Tax=Streptomyces TaxID=1883 RepID=A0A918BIV0_9ACTN|nr:hypothetical protein GCM10010145_47070 [Streptomyces ruber]